jgi:soluble lytic murein transglycosylase-like protein
MIRLLLPALLLSATCSQAAELSPELKTFLGAPPAGFAAKYRAPAKRLRRAFTDYSEGRHAKAAGEFAALNKGVFADHALFFAGKAAREAKEFSKSTDSLQRLRREFPNSAYDDEAIELLQENSCDEGLRAKKADLLRRCLDGTAWKFWGEREAQATALYEILKVSNDPLLKNYVAELIQGMPANTNLRIRLAKEIKSAELETYASIPRFRSRQVNPPGVKPVNPDQVLFDEGMQSVLQGKWGSARSAFLQFEKDFPGSEHRDRAAYWIARSYDATGDEEEAHRRYEAIFSDNPLTYYGLQAALRLKKDLTPFLAPTKLKASEFQGTPIPRQQLSLWRLRALLEEGLLEIARMEAKSLFFMKPGGSTFGQDNGAGAALVALLYDTASYSNGAFSHAYAALTLDPALLNSAVLPLIFPKPFEKDFAVAAGASGVHPLLLLSVAKQESAFLPNAISKANAFGLMQLLLGTAQEMDSKLKRDDLFTPAANTMAGSRYLGKLLDRFQGNIALALAGYNAGPTRAAQWQKKMLESEAMKKAFDIDIFIDTIPFTETRKYVGSILRNYAWYKLLRKEKVETVQELAFQWQRNKNEAPVSNKELPPGTMPAGIAAPPPNPLPPLSPKPSEAPSAEPLPASAASPPPATSPTAPANTAPAAPTTPENPESTGTSPR